MVHHIGITSCCFDVENFKSKRGVPPAPKYAIHHQPYHAQEPLVSQSAHPRCGALAQIERLGNPNRSYLISMIPNNINPDNPSLLSAGNKIQYSKDTNKYNCSKSPVIAA